MLLLAACRTPASLDPAASPSPASILPAAAAPVVAATPEPVGPAPDPSRFQQDVLLEGVLDEPTEIAVAHDGRVFLAQRGGNLKVYDPRSREARDVGGMPAVNSADENGLIGVVLDPGFARNGWIYLNYTIGAGDRHRLSRFTLQGDTLRDEKSLLEVKIDKGCCHTAGSMAFDRNGNLFVSYGDNTGAYAAGTYAPVDPSPTNLLGNALRSSANTQDLRGKILRITPTADGRYTVPAGNLFANAGEGRPEIYVMGNRNPYRISVDSRTGFVYWGEIGPDGRVDSTLGPRGYDEVNQARRAGNFGWPMFIADNKPYRYYNYGTREMYDMFDAARPLNNSPANTGAKVLPPPQPAMIFYPYEASERFPGVGEGGRSAMVGPVYHAADYAGSRVKLPEHYDGKLIFYEWMRGWMRAATFNAAGDFVRMEPFLGHLTFDHPTDVELGPDGALYVAEYGTYWFAKNKNSRLSRITYHPDNRPPVALITASDSAGAAPLVTQLSADGSFDRDAGDSLRFTWSIAGAPDREGARISHTFATPGTHRVRLRVRDRAGEATETFTDIRVGNAPPKVALTVAGNRSFYWDTPTLPYRVEVTDAEDTRGGRRIDPRRIAVSMTYERSGAPAATGTAVGHRSAPANGLALITQSGCVGCHGVTQSSIGPAYTRVAQRYASRADAATYLTNKIATGSTGVWSERVMPPHAHLTPEVRRAMADYILSLNAQPGKLPPRGQVALDKHAAAPGGVYRLTAAYTDTPRNGIGALADTAVVVLRPATILVRDALDLRRSALRVAKAPDGTDRPVATVYEDSASVSLGRLDLTGVSRVGFDLRSERSKHPFSVELRADNAGGPLLGRVDVTPSTGEEWYRQVVPVSAGGERSLFVVVRSPVSGLGQWNPVVKLDGIHFERAAAPSVGGR